MSASANAREILLEENPEALFLKNYDCAMIGVARRPDGFPVAAYDYQKIIKGLIKGGMSDDEAEDYFERNINCEWKEKTAPIFIQRT